MPHPLSLLLLLLLSCHVAGVNLKETNLNPLPSLYVPIGVGTTVDPAQIPEKEKGYGVFGDYIDELAYDSKDKKDITTQFSVCGTKTLSAMNPNFKQQGNKEYQIVCDPSPDRIIVRTDGKPFDFGTYQRDLTKECELLTCSDESYPAEHTNLGKMNIKSWHVEVDGQGKEVAQSKESKLMDVPDVPVVSGAPERLETNVCKDKKAGYSKNAGSVLISNEAQCYKTYDNLKAKLENIDFMQIPRWLQPGEKVRNIRSAFYDAERQNFLQRVPYSFQSLTEMNDAKFHACESACDKGQIVKLTMKKTIYRIAITVKETCPSFRICLSPEKFDDDTSLPICVPHLTIDVLVKNGIVIWPNQGRASLIELRSPKRDPAHPTMIEFGYGVDVNTKQRAEYYIGNDHREIVTSTSSGFSSGEASKVSFFFPHADCLVQTAGVFTRSAETGKILSNEAPTKVGVKYDDNFGPIDAPQNEKPVTTTTVLPIAIPATTTQPAPRAIPGGAVLPDKDKQSMTSADMQSAVFVAGKWWTWGIYLGFVIGTLLTLGVGGGLFYLLRRTIFAIWYRGMYKRYGCDASGTTGGLTGVGFGDTVTGDVTVQGTTGGTTMGGATSTGTSTGGGTTGTSTMGATETSTLLDKTEGHTKSIAM